MNPLVKTKKQAAEFLAMSEKSIDRFRESGDLRPPIHPGIKIKVLIPVYDLVALEKKLRQCRERDCGSLGDAQEKNRSQPSLAPLK